MRFGLLKKCITFLFSRVSLKSLTYFAILKSFHQDQEIRIQTAHKYKLLIKFLKLPLKRIHPLQTISNNNKLKISTGKKIIDFLPTGRYFITNDKIQISKWIFSMHAMKIVLMFT